MTEIQAGKKKQRHRTRAEADELAAEYEKSGLTREEFCRQKNVPLKTLCRYVTRRRKQSGANAGSQRWVKVEVEPRRETGGDLAVVLSCGRRIEVKRGFDVSTLQQLVTVLERI